MAKSKLPRELELRIRQLANERAKLAGAPGYRSAYVKAKAQLLAQVVTLFAQGLSVEEVTKQLGGRQLASARLSKSIREIQKAILSL